LLTEKKEKLARDVRAYTASVEAHLRARPASAPAAPAAPAPGSGLGQIHRDLVALNTTLRGILNIMRDEVSRLSSCSQGWRMLTAGVAGHGPC
jgi:hypothetical protein